MVSNNKLESMTEQQRYRKRNRKKCLEKGRKYCEENKERLQNTGICLKKTGKN